MTRSPTHHAPWQRLGAHAERLRQTTSRTLAADPARASYLCVEAAGVFADFSRQRLDRAVLEELLQLADSVALPAARRAMLRGDHINTTEQRAALHVALRAPEVADGLGLPPAALAEVAAMRARMADFCARFEAGQIRGVSGLPLRNIVNIGIGGSDLGPRMVFQALAPYRRPGVTVHFVANVDGHDVASVLERCDPATTLVVVASKTFTTQETMTNAETAREWLVAGTGDAGAVAAQFVALSTNAEAVARFGIAPERMFGFWDWVGGRYSLWSAVGLSVALAVGFDNFAALLAGAHQMDRHFAEAPVAANLPILLALVGVWNRNFLGIGTHAVLPYDERLRRLPAFLQQLEMESNGKTVHHDGSPVATATAPVLWGEPGTNGQHAFYQYLHQGSELAALDLIALARPGAGALEGWRARLGAQHHTALLANALAQAEAFANGRTEGEAIAAMRDEGLGADEAARLAPHRTFAGNRPLTFLVCESLTPAALGALIALYEHKVFCQGVIWGINSFDQFGVELGKAIARRLEPALRGECEPAAASADPSTQALIERLNRLRGRSD